MLYNYSFANRKRDLADVMATVIKDEPRFISNFRPAAPAISAKHEYLEDNLAVKGFVALDCNNGTLCVPETVANMLKNGMVIRSANDPALFEIKEIDGNKITLALACHNGSAKINASDLTPEDKTFYFVSPQNSNEDSDEFISRVEWNATQIFRKEIVLYGTALAMDLYGSVDNQLNRQTAFALADLARDLNRVALFGRRVEKTDEARGEAGGLYYFAAETNAPKVDAKGAMLDSFMLNDAASQIIFNGGEPMQILCSPGQARVLTQEYRDRIQILRSDDRRGAYVAVIVNEINGRGMTIMADPETPDKDVWVLDTGCFALANLHDRAITDVDVTPSGFDGIRRVATGELTFEFRNVQQRCFRFANLKSSAESLAALRSK